MLLFPVCVQVLRRVIDTLTPRGRRESSSCLSTASSDLPGQLACTMCNAGYTELVSFVCILVYAACDFRSGMLTSPNSSRNCLSWVYIVHWIPSLFDDGGMVALDFYESKSRAPYYTWFLVCVWMLDLGLAFCGCNTIIVHNGRDGPAHYTMDGGSTCM